MLRTSWSFPNIDTIGDVNVQNSNIITAEYMRNIGKSQIYIVPELTAGNEQWINPGFGNPDLQAHYDYIKLSDRKVQEFINEFFPVTEDLTDGQRKNNLRLQEDLKARYYNAPDLEWVGKNGWRFVNAVSDFATHADPIRDRILR